MFQDKSASLFLANSAIQSPERNAEQFLGSSATMWQGRFLSRSAKMFPDSNVQMFQGKSARMFLVNSAVMYQDKSARLCRDNSVTLCQDSSVVMYLNRSVPLFRGNNVKMSLVNSVVRCPSRSVRQLNLHMEESKQKKQKKPRLTICKTKPPNERFKFLSRTPDSSTIL